MEMADHLASDGYKDAGYQYVNIDVREAQPMVSPRRFVLLMALRILETTY